MPLEAQFLPAAVPAGLPSRLLYRRPDIQAAKRQLYRGGAASYLAVLTNQTNYFAAQLNLARARLNERLALVELYVALGGGWDM